MEQNLKKGNIVFYHHFGHDDQSFAIVLSSTKKVLKLQSLDITTLTRIDKFDAAEKKSLRFKIYKAFFL